VERPATIRAAADRLRALHRALPRAGPIYGLIGSRSTFALSASLAPPIFGVPWAEIRLSKSSASTRAKSLRTLPPGGVTLFSQIGPITHGVKKPIGYMTSLPSVEIRGSLS